MLWFCLEIKGMTRVRVVEVETINFTLDSGTGAATARQCEL